MDEIDCSGHIWLYFVEATGSLDFNCLIKIRLTMRMLVDCSLMAKE